MPTDPGTAAVPEPHEAADAVLLRVEAASTPVLEAEGSKHEP